MKPEWKAGKFYQVLADELQAAYEDVAFRGKDARLIIEAPPQHGKSTEVSELFAAWVMGRSSYDFPEGWPVICASYAMNLAEKKSQHARDIVGSEIYQWIFPEAGLSENATSKEYWENKKKASYKAVGRGGGLTGNPGKVLIADDLIADKEEANSETTREGAWDWWGTVFMSRKQEISLIILVETRWHLDDPAGKLEAQQEENERKNLPEGTYDKWKRLTFPAIADEDVYINDVLFQKKGEALAPTRFSLAALTKTKNALIAAGKIGDWASLYQQTPIISENAVFRKQWFKYYEPNQLIGKKLYYTTTVDLAISQKQTADNTVIRTVAKEKDGPNWYLMEETAGRMDPLQTIDAIFHHYQQYRSKVYIESVGYQASLQYFLIEEQRKRQEYFTVEELKVSNTRRKEERISGLVPLYRAGVIYHRKGQDEGLELEAMQFPKGRHDDRLDALSMHLQVVRHSARTLEANQPQQTQSLTQSWKARQRAGGFDPSAPFDPV